MPSSNVMAILRGLNKFWYKQNGSHDFIDVAAHPGEKEFIVVYLTVNWRGMVDLYNLTILMYAVFGAKEKKTC